MGKTIGPATTEYVVDLATTLPVVISDAVKQAGDEIPRLPTKWRPEDFARLGL